MNESRYTDGVGGITDGGIGRDRNSGTDTRELEPEWQRERGFAGLDDERNGLGIGFAGGSFAGDGSCERELDGWSGGASAEHAGRQDGQGGGVADGHRERDLSGSGERGSRQNRRQPAEIKESGSTPSAKTGAEAGAELARLISDASSALAHLDAKALEDLGRKAESLSTFNLGGAGVRDTALIPVLEARYRVFAALLKATGENLATLQRAEAQDSMADGGYTQSLAPRGLFESFGMYDEADVNRSIWPVDRLAKARNQGPGQA
jgi:hypothetical protein